MIGFLGIGVRVIGNHNCMKPGTYWRLTYKNDALGAVFSSETITLKTFL